MDYYFELKRNKKYRKYLFKRRIRVLLACLFLMLLFLGIQWARNPEADEQVIVMVYTILILISILVIRIGYLSFKKPICGKGVVVDNRLSNRIVTSSAGDTKRKVLHEFAVMRGEQFLWGKNIDAYLGKDYEEIDKGDSVLWFEQGNGNVYFIKL